MELTGFKTLTANNTTCYGYVVKNDFTTDLRDRKEELYIGEKRPLLVENLGGGKPQQMDGYYLVKVDINTDLVVHKATDKFLTKLKFKTTDENRDRLHMVSKMNVEFVYFDRHGRMLPLPKKQYNNNHAVSLIIYKDVVTEREVGKLIKSKERGYKKPTILRGLKLNDVQNPYKGLMPNGLFQVNVTTKFVKVAEREGLKVLRYEVVSRKKAIKSMAEITLSKGKVTQLININQQSWD